VIGAVFTRPPRARRFLAEALGTFTLVFAGCGAIMVDASQGGLGTVGIAATFGLVIAVMVVALGPVSGAHLNPVVSVALAAIGRFAWREVPGYVAAQLAGAIAAAGLLRASLGNVAGIGATAPAGSDGQSFVWEVVLTAVLLLVVVAVVSNAPGSAAAGLAIGGTVALASLCGGAISGASMNPARSLGPALVAGDMRALWIYLAAPVLGGVVGAAAYRAIGARASATRDLAEIEPDRTAA